MLNVLRTRYERSSEELQLESIFDHTETFLDPLTKPRHPSTSKSVLILALLRFLWLTGTCTTFNQNWSGVTCNCCKHRVSWFFWTDRIELSEKVTDLTQKGFVRSCWHFFGRHCWRQDHVSSHEPLTIRWQFPITPHEASRALLIPLWFCGYGGSFRFPYALNYMFVGGRDELKIILPFSSSKGLKTALSWSTRITRTPSTPSSGPSLIRGRSRRSATTDGWCWTRFPGRRSTRYFCDLRFSLFRLRSAVLCWWWIHHFVLSWFNLCFVVSYSAPCSLDHRSLPNKLLLLEGSGQSGKSATVLCTRLRLT